MELVQKIGSWLAAITPMCIFVYWVLGKMLKNNADNINTEHNIKDLRKDVDDHEVRLRELEK